MRRRKFVKTIGTLIPGALMIPSFLSAKPLPKISSGTVIIVGAGAAGLYAAKTLKEAGINVIILEASTTHGGRVRPIAGFADFNVEAGAEFVHGKGNIAGDPPSFLWSSINAYDPSLLLEYGGYKELYQIGTGYETDPPYWNAELENAWQFYLNMYSYAGDDILMSEHLAVEYGIDEAHPYWHIYDAWIGSEFGTSIKRIGMKSIAISENLWLTGDQDFLLDTSYLPLLETLFFAPVLGDIQYNKIVTSITYSATSVSVNCGDGSIFTGDKALVTVPLTILKENSILFDPVLPTEKISAIETIGMGAGMKLILKFSQTFWTDEIQGMTMEGYTSYIWSPGLGKTGATNNVLICFIMGENAEYMSSIDAGAVDVALAELDLLFGGAASLYFMESSIQDWSLEPFIKGAYSFPSPGTYTSETESCRLDLAAPVNCALFFAGEATNNYHPATVHGALESGARAAAEIIECLSVGTNETLVSDFVHLYAENSVVYFELNTLRICNARFSVYNLSGSKVVQLFYDKIPAGKNTWSFSVSDLAKGNYILEAILEDVVYTQQVSIQF